MKKYKDFIISIVIVMGTQGLIYFLIKQFLGDHNVMSTFVEVPLIKYFVYFYDSWYPFILLSAFIIYKHDKATYFTLIITMMISALLAHITFLVYPTEIVRPDINVTTLTDWALDLTYKSDTPAVNCLPSVHCLYCFVVGYFTIICKKLKTKYKVILTIYSLLIVLSTVFIKQHIIEDIILSIIYTVIMIPAAYLIKNQIKNFRIFKSFKEN